MNYVDHRCANPKCPRPRGVFRIAESDLTHRLAHSHGYRVFCRQTCYQEWRRIGREKRLARAAVVALALLMLPALALSAVVPMTVLTPCTNDDATDSTDATPLTDLKQINVWWQRCGRVDSLLLGVIPAAGRECDSLPFDIQIDSIGTTYDLWAYAEDFSGNKSILAIHCAIAVPWEDYAYGLWGTYYSDTTFTQPVTARLDPTLDVEWSGVPAAGVPDDGFGVRWAGRIRTLAGGTYAFRAYINNGFRMRIGGEPVIDGTSWTNPNTHWSSGSIDLAAGTEYDFSADFRDEQGLAFVHLYWTPPGSAEQIVPASAFVH